MTSHHEEFPFEGMDVNERLHNTLEEPAPTSRLGTTSSNESVKIWKKLGFKLVVLAIVVRIVHVFKLGYLFGEVNKQRDLFVDDRSYGEAIHPVLFTDNCFTVFPVHDDSARIVSIRSEYCRNYGANFILHGYIASPHKESLDMLQRCLVDFDIFWYLFFHFYMHSPYIC